MGNPIAFVEITGPQGAVLQDFYATVFGWKVDSKPFPSYAYMSQESDQSIRVGIREEAADQPAERILYLKVPDLQAALDQVEANGGKTLLPPTEVAAINLNFALFMDPAGNKTGLIKG